MSCIPLVSCWNHLDQLFLIVLWAQCTLLHQTLGLLSDKDLWCAITYVKLLHSLVCYLYEVIVYFAVKICETKLMLWWVTVSCYSNIRSSDGICVDLKPQGGVVDRLKNLVSNLSPKKVSWVSLICWFLEKKITDPLPRLLLDFHFF